MTLTVQDGTDVHDVHVPDEQLHHWQETHPSSVILHATPEAPQQAPQ